MSDNPIKPIIEAALFAAGEALSIERLQALFGEEGQPSKGSIREVLETLQEESDDRGIELVEVASGFRYQSREQHATYVGRLWDERPPRYSRALLETLALVAYRQPTTRAEVEDIRGVSVSSNIMRTLQERGWVRIVGHRDVPGKPAMYATTREFLDYFNLKGLDDLPPLAELRDIDKINEELDLREPGQTLREAANSAEAMPARSPSVVSTPSETPVSPDPHPALRRRPKKRRARR